MVITVIPRPGVLESFTARQIVELLRRNGARAVQFLVSSPPVKFPDFYGTDTPDEEELIAAAMSVEELRQLIGADTLGYLSHEGMIRATGRPESWFSTSCFNGVYPVDVGRPIERAGVGRSARE